MSVLVAASQHSWPTPLDLVTLAIALTGAATGIFGLVLAERRHRETGTLAQVSLDPPHWGRSAFRVTVRNTGRQPFEITAVRVWATGSDPGELLANFQVEELLAVAFAEKTGSTYAQRLPQRVGPGDAPAIFDFGREDKLQGVESFYAVAVLGDGSSWFSETNYPAVFAAQHETVRRLLLESGFEWERDVGGLRKTDENATDVAATDEDGNEA